MEKKINLIGISGRISSGKDTVANMIQVLTAHPLSGRREDGFMPPTWQIKKFAYKLKQMVSLLTGIPVEDLEKQEVKDRVLGEEWRNYYYYLGIRGTLTKEKRYISKKGYEEILSRPMENHGANTEVITVREMLQKLGTEGVRNTIHPNAWVNALFADYKGFMEPYVDMKSELLLDLALGMYSGKCQSCGERFSGYKRQTRCQHCIETDGPIYPNWLITDCRFPNEAQAIKDRGGIVLRINRSSSFVRDAHPSETSLDNYNFDYTIENIGDLQYLQEEVKEFLKHYNLI